MYTIFRMITSRKGEYCIREVPSNFLKTDFPIYSYLIHPSIIYFS
jgi:hypothetical protein